MAFDHYVDMELEDEDALDAVAAAPMATETPKYPWGLRICLTNKELDKLSLDGAVDVGALLHFKALAKVTSVSSNEMEGGVSCQRVELQIVQMNVEDGE